MAQPQYDEPRTPPPQGPRLVRAPKPTPEEAIALLRAEVPPFYPPEEERAGPKDVADEGVSIGVVLLGLLPLLLWVL